MAIVVYVLCTLTSGLCAVLLLKEYRRTRLPLLLWSGASFCLIAAANALVFVDFIVLPDVDLTMLRALAMAVAVFLLLYGLVWKAE
jgi:hypothetical protein